MEIFDWYKKQTNESLKQNEFSPTDTVIFTYQEARVLCGILDIPCELENGIIVSVYASIGLKVLTSGSY